MIVPADNGELLVSELAALLSVQSVYGYYLDASWFLLLVRMVFVSNVAFKARMSVRKPWFATLMFFLSIPVLVRMWTLWGGRRTYAFVNFMRLEDSLSFQRLAVHNLLIALLQMSLLTAKHNLVHGTLPVPLSFSPAARIGSVSGPV